MSHVGIRIFSEDDELHALDGSFADSIGYQFDMAKMATALISPYLDPLTGLIELEQLLS